MEGGEKTRRLDEIVPWAAGSQIYHEDTNGACQPDKALKPISMTFASKFDVSVENQAGNALEIFRKH